VFENRVLRSIIGPQREEVTGEWRKLHKDELNDLYCSPNIVQGIKSRRMRWAVYMARMGRGEAYTGFWWGNLKERDHLEVSCVDGLIILRWICAQLDKVTHQTTTSGAHRPPTFTVQGYISITNHFGLASNSQG
jgi:hypothetical protein